MPPPTTVPKSRTKYIYGACVSITGQMHSDQTCALSIASISGNKYTFCLLDDDSNYIDAIPIHSQAKQQILKAYQKAPQC